MSATSLDNIFITWLHNSFLAHVGSMENINLANYDSGFCLGCYDCHSQSLKPRQLEYFKNKEVTIARLSKKGV